MKAHNIGLQAAADMAGEHFSKLVQQFNDDKATLFKTKPDIAEQLKELIYAMECMVSGNLYWSAQSKRYFGERREEIMRTRMVHLTPSRGEVKH